MSGITTHVLDTSRGRPASGVPVVLERQEDTHWREIGRDQTDGDGRARQLLPEKVVPFPGTFRLTFDTGAYFRAQGIDGFFPEVSVVFLVRGGEQHYHVPLLLSPYGYSTYRGS